MSDVQSLSLLISCKATAILTIMATITLLAARRWPSGCLQWHRVGITALLVLPVAGTLLPSVSIPVLPERPILPRIEQDNSVAFVATVDQTPASISAPAMPVTAFDEIDFETRSAQPVVEESLLQTFQEPVFAANLPEPMADKPPRGNRLVLGIAFAYLLVVAALLVRILTAWRGIHHLRRFSSPISNPDWMQSLMRWRTELRVGRTVELRVTDEVSIPMTFGWIAPVILIPRDCLNANEFAQREAILIHELVHIANGDFLWQILGRLASATYWIHPLIWFVHRETEAMRERLCDLYCSQQLGHESYARSLIHIAARSRKLPAGYLGMAMAQRSSLRRRLDDLRSLGTSPVARSGRTSSALICATATLVLGIVVIGLLTQRASKNFAPRANLKSTDTSNANDKQPDRISPASNSNQDDDFRAEWRRILVTAGREEDFATAVMDAPLYSLSNPVNLLRQTFVLGAGFMVPDRVGPTDSVSLESSWRQLRATPIDVAESDFASPDPETRTRVINKLLECCEEELEWLTKAFNKESAATVNSVTIRNSEILFKYVHHLKSARERFLHDVAQAFTATTLSKPEFETAWMIYCDRRHDYRKILHDLVQRHVNEFIQNELFVQYSYSHSTPEQTGEIRARADALFQSELGKLIEELKVKSVEDLDRKLQEMGTTLLDFKAEVTRKMLAEEIMATRLVEGRTISDDDIMNYYKTYRDLFKLEKSADWQLIGALKSHPDDSAVPKQQVEHVLAEFAKGRSFKDDSLVSRDLDLTKPYKRSFKEMPIGSDEMRGLEELIFTIPLQQWSEIIETDGRVFSIRVTRREEAGTPGIERVRDRIVKTLSQKQIRQEFYDEVYQSAQITSAYSVYYPSEHSRSGLRARPFMGLRQKGLSLTGP